MSLKIEYVHRMDDGLCERCIPVVRLDELRRWLEARSDAWHTDGDYMGIHVCVDDLLAELKEVQP